MEAPLQRMLTRAARANARIKRKRDAKEMSAHLDEHFMHKHQMIDHRKNKTRVYQTAKQNRNEDWAVGNRLLPRRNIGSAELTLGTIESSLLYEPPKPEKFREKPWLAVGDRVVLLTGMDKGKIGEVKSVDEDAMVVAVKNLNKVNWIVPDYIAEEHGTNYTPTVLQDRPLPWRDVKLVAPVPDDTGAFRDVVVDKLEIREPGRRKLREDPKAKSQRIIPGMNIQVPWPADVDEDFTANDVDTLRLTVDTTTMKFNTLAHPPMPPSVIDELRHKYSKLRTRHDPEYIAKKEAKVRIEEDKEDALSELVRTPMERTARAHKAAKAERRPMLSDEQLSVIGETMARERAAAAAKNTSSS